MKKSNEKIARLFGIFMVLLGVPLAFVSALAILTPGTSSNFSVLAGSAITNIGTTTISGTSGNIGIYPGTAVTGTSTLTYSGALHTADGVASIAKDDLVTIYTQTSNITPVTRINSELGGQTLTPGIYDSADGKFQITGTLTLNAEGNADAVFVFKTASTLITASASQVSLINDANYCQIFWKVGSSATLGTNSNFSGRIYALSSITATTGATISGQLLARNGAVTLDSNTITTTSCSATSTIAGGELPATSSNLYLTLFSGVILVILGTIFLVLGRHYAKTKYTQ